MDSCVEGTLRYNAYVYSFTSDLTGRLLQQALYLFSLENRKSPDSGLCKAGLTGGDR
jgi:hypothetical protein